MTFLFDDDLTSLRSRLFIDEGYRQFPYKDTVGKLTVGIGRNLDDVGISKDEAAYLLNNDINVAAYTLVKAFPWTANLDGIRKQVLVNMTLNMGIGKLKGFVNTLAAVKRGDYAAASAGMLDSLWARQVGDRAKRLARMMETGIN